MVTGGRLMVYLCVRWYVGVSPVEGGCNCLMSAIKDGESVVSG